VSIGSIQLSHCSLVERNDDNDRTGVPGRIQASQSTADLLKATGRDHWVTPRQDSVLAKGKGVVHTYWIHPHAVDATPSTVSSDRGDTLSAGQQPPAADQSAPLFTSRSIEWMTQLLLEYAIKIRGAMKHTSSSDVSGSSSDLWLSQLPTGQTPLAEVAEVINLKKFDEYSILSDKKGDEDTVAADPEIVKLIRDLVIRIAMTYRDNPFHNFEHGTSYE
jgi:hypothetical protein